MSLALALQYGTLILSHIGTFAKVIGVVEDLASKDLTNDQKKAEATTLLEGLVSANVMSKEQLDDLIESAYKGLKFFGLIKDATSTTPVATAPVVVPVAVEVK